jgi:hypothetical protein
MTETLTIISERVDDIPLLLAQLERMGVPAPFKPRQNFLSAGGELTRPYLVHINSTSPQGRTAAGESPRCIRVKVFKSKWLH